MPHRAATLIVISIGPNGGSSSRAPSPRPAYKSYRSLPLRIGRPALYSKHSRQEVPFPVVSHAGSRRRARRITAFGFFFSGTGTYGSILRGLCKCGFDTGDIFAGGGFVNFMETCNAPAMCQQLPRVPRAQLHGPGRRPMPGMWYVGHLLRQPLLYDDPKKTRYDYLFVWRIADKDEFFKLPDTDFLCPKCGKMTLVFEEDGALGIGAEPGPARGVPRRGRGDDSRLNVYGQPVGRRFFPIKHLNITTKTRRHKAPFWLSLRGLVPLRLRCQPPTPARRNPPYPGRATRSPSADQSSAGDPFSLVLTANAQ